MPHSPLMARRSLSVPKIGSAPIDPAMRVAGSTGEGSAQSVPVGKEQT
jgi:hypothetical protein